MADIISLDAGVILFLLMALAAVGYSNVRRGPKDGTDWRDMTRNHLPHPNMSEDEINRVFSRKDFEEALLSSEVRHFTQPKMVTNAVRGKITRNELEAEINGDIRDRAGDALKPQEAEKLANDAYDMVMNAWFDAARKKQDTWLLRPT